MDWSEGEGRDAKRPGHQPESEGKRPGGAANPSVTGSARIAAQGRLDRSEGEGRDAKRPGHQPESEGKRPAARPIRA